MSESGKRPRPARILMISTGPDVDRMLDLLVTSGHLVEATSSATAAVKRLARMPAVEIALVGGLGDLDRALVMAAAGAAGIWCAYLRTSEAVPRFSAEERSHLLATIDCRLDDARVRKAIQVLVSARRHPAAASEDEVG